MIASATAGGAIESKAAAWRAELAAVLGDEALCGQLLRQAEHGYQEIGAPGHVERLTKEPGP